MDANKNITANFAVAGPQTVSAMWPLTVDTAAIVTGNITAPPQSCTDPVSIMSVKDYLGGTAASPPGPVDLAERLWLTGANWPQDDNQNNGRYIQYSVTPNVGYNFTVQSITLNIGCYGTNSHMFASVYCSTDPTFATSTLLSSSGLPDIRGSYMTALSFNPGTVTASGETFYLRVYPWYNSDPSPTKYVCINNVTISGSTAVAGAPTMTIFPSSVSFGQVNVNASKVKAYSISGSQLVPAGGVITISAPMGFEVSTNPVSGFSSSVFVPYSGGALNSTTIFVKFMPTMISDYNGIITNDGGGTTTQNVTVTGTGVSSDVILGLFVSTTGSDSNPGTYDLPFATIPKAVSVAEQGDTIFVRGGSYSINTTIGISKIGLSYSRHYLFAYRNERPILDFSSMAFSSTNRGINLIGSYWHIKGIDIKGAGDNGMNISGSNNIIEFCALYENQDSGLQLSSGASNNQVINCDSYYNYDAPNGGENADGFSPKLDVGTGNFFYGCRSWQNSDDGWDGYQAIALTTIENCWAFSNGYLKNGSASESGDGNGFKMGGAYTQHDHVLKNCLAFGNMVKGFDQNHNKGSMTLYNCTGYGNGGYNYAISEALDPGKTLTLTNCVELGTNRSIGSFAVQTNNSWQMFTVTSADFVSLDTLGVHGPRKPDGSLPDVNFMHLAVGSALIDTGIYVGTPYEGFAPDLGAFESSYPNFTLTINATNGTVAQSPNRTIYDSLAIVLLTATPASGYAFTGWTGNVPAGHETDNPLTLTMNANKNITVNFTGYLVKTPVSAGWNLVSVPLVPSNYSAGVLFPNKLGSMYVYNSALRDYQAAPILANGPGYWLNNSKTDTVGFNGSVPGSIVDTATQAGWILIGSRDTTFHVSLLILSDGAIRMGSAYRYDAAARIYQATPVINPGEAVWINVNKGCTITLP